MVLARRGGTSAICLPGLAATPLVTPAGPAELWGEAGAGEETGGRNPPVVTGVVEGAAKVRLTSVMGRVLEGGAGG